MVPLVANGTIGNQRTLNVSRQPMVPLVETLVPMVPLLVPMVPLVVPIHHICINSLVPSVKKINIGNPGIQVNYWGGLNPPH